MAAPGTTTVAPRSATASRCPVPPRWTTSFGRGPRRAGPTETTSSTTTGTGSGTGAPARRSTTAPTRSTSAAGRSVSICRPGSPPTAAATLQGRLADARHPGHCLGFCGREVLSWEGRSCNELPDEGLTRGAIIYGTEGTALLEGNNYTVFDNKNKKVKAGREGRADPTNTQSGTGIGLDRLHVQNFVDAIAKGSRPNSPIEEGHKSVTMLHLGNIAWRWAASSVRPGQRPYPERRRGDEALAAGIRAGLGAEGLARRAALEAQRDDRLFQGQAKNRLPRRRGGEHLFFA